MSVNKIQRLSWESDSCFVVIKLWDNRKRFFFVFDFDSFVFEIVEFVKFAYKFTKPKIISKRKERKKRLQKERALFL